ncbi:ThuA domain-containing protein [Bailinhaonella thermotolerans]|nr:ThuA domain-containing protein [Bailinhaonella thermotolerans]
MAWNLILSGGVAHDFAASSGVLAEVLAEVGIESEVTEDIAGALAEPPEVQLITVNAMRWRMDGPHFRERRERWRFELPTAARNAVLDHLDRGGGLLAMHAAPICFDDWIGWSRVIGARWNWEKSHHEPLGWASVRVHRGRHPIVDGLRDFDVADEIYTDLDLEPGLTPLVSCDGRPLVWARHVRRGRVVYDALGHDTRSFDSPEHRALVQRAALWTLRRLPAR